MTFEELDLFSFSTPRYKITKCVRLIELFGGVGCQAKALENLGVKFEHHRLIEVDQNCIKSYNAIHGTNFTTQDITQTHASDLGITDRESYTYIVTYSFPCQDLSVSGLQKGMEKGSGTRSGLLWEVERILDECGDNLPDLLIMENVPNILGKANIKSFQSWRRKLESLGYSNHVKMMNSKHHGIPQNRNRCFMVSILGDYYYEFPPKRELKLKMKDLLEDNVDEKYYLSERALKGILHTSYQSGKLESRVEKDGIMSTLRARDYKDPKLTLMINNATKQGYLEAEEGDGIDLSTRPKNHRGTVQKGISQTIQTEVTVGTVERPRRLFNIYGPGTGTGHAGNVWDTEFVSPTIDTCAGGNRQPLIEDMPKLIGGVGDMKSNDGRQFYQQDRVYDSDGVALCQSAHEQFNPYYKVYQQSWLSQKGVDYICDPKRGMSTDINPNVAQPLTAKGQQNWTGSFISPDIKSIEKSTEIGSTEPTRINLENGEQITSDMKDKMQGLRIRKITPKEAWRLMGWDDESFAKAESQCSNSTLYKQAGNGIVIQVMEDIFRMLY